MLRRLHQEQPDSFAFTPANQAWAEGQISKYPEGRQASAIIPLLWRAQEQEGWLSRPAIEHVADMLGMAHIRALEVATFYFMFQLQPVGNVAHIQICGTTSCMICGAEDLVAVCRDKIAAKPHQLSEDGKLSWEEVECLGACANAPMAQIGKDYYEDLTAERFGEILEEIRAGKVPTPGPQNGRFAAEPKSGLTSLQEYEDGRNAANASVALATDLGDGIKRIDGTEVPLLTPWLGSSGKKPSTSGKGSDKKAVQKPDAPVAAPEAAEKPSKPAPKAKKAARPKSQPASESLAVEAKKPSTLSAPRDGGADDLKMIKGIGPKLEAILNDIGFFHYDQIANWGQAEIKWADSELPGFKGRASRDNWIDQAKILASGAQTEFSKRAKY